LDKVLMHWTQALVRLPDAKVSHCKLGYFLFFSAGLYLPRSLLRGVSSIEPLPQTAHVLNLDIIIYF